MEAAAKRSGAAVNAAVYILGILLQGVAALLALWQVRSAPRRLPWLLIALSSLLIVARRSVTLQEVTRARQGLAPAEVLTLAVSLLFFLGVLYMTRFFREVHQDHEALRLSEERQAAALAGSREGVWDRDLVTGEVVYSLGWKRMLGYRDDEVPNHLSAWERLVHPEDLERVEGAVRDFVEGRSAVYEAEMRMRHRDGHWLDILSRGDILRNADGQPVRLVGTHVDISALRRAERALARSEALLQAVQHLTRVGGWEWDVAGRRMTWTEELYRLHGLEPGAMEPGGPDCIARSLACYAPEDRPAVQAAFEQCALTGEPYDLELPFTTFEGTKLWIRTMGRAVLEGGRVIKVLGNMVDITREWQAERDLKESRHFVERILDSSPNLIYIYDLLEHRNVYSNREVADFLGYTPDMIEAFGGSLFEHILHPEDASRVAEHHARLGSVKDQVVLELDYRMRHADGQYRWLRSRDMAFLRDEGGVKQILGTAEDITSRREADEARRAALAYARNLIETSLDPLATISPEGRITDVNRATERATGLGREVLVGRDFSDFFTDPGMAKAGYRKVFAEGQVVDYPLALRHTSGSVVDVLYNATLLRGEEGTVLGVLASARDVTALRRAEADKMELEARSQRLQRAESLARMAGAIAHHFNNQMQAVMGNLELIRLLPPGEGSARSVTQGLAAARRAAEVSRLMLTYLGQSFGEHEPLDLATLCQDLIPLLQASMPMGVELETRWPTPGPVVMGDAEQLRRMAVNLATNAWEAMTQGRLRIEVGTVAADAIPLKHRRPYEWQAEAGRYAFLEVSDAGEGIDEADLDKLFDPFYSTRFTGRGLGLPVVLGILRGHGGAITVASQPGHGSYFRVFLPLSGEAMRKELPERAMASEGMVLLVDDDPFLLMTTGFLIRDLLGLPLVTAKDGIEALEVYREHRSEIRCVICDLTMPRMDGWQTLAALRRLSPELPVILASGYDKARAMAGEHRDKPQGFLGKPFELQQLKEALAQVMSPRAG